MKTKISGLFSKAEIASAATFGAVSEMRAKSIALVFPTKKAYTLWLKGQKTAFPERWVKLIKIRSRDA